jgi:hypothetical protein
VLKEYERAMNQTKGLCRNESNKGFVPQWILKTLTVPSREVERAHVYFPEILEPNQMWLRHIGGSRHIIIIEVSGHQYATKRKFATEKWFWFWFLNLSSAIWEIPRVSFLSIVTGGTWKVLKNKNSYYIEWLKHCPFGPLLICTSPRIPPPPHNLLYVFTGYT